MMKRPINAALHDRKIALDRIRMDIATNIFADAVINRLMTSKLGTDLLSGVPSLFVLELILARSPA
jgi:hypothetical protein